MKLSHPFYISSHLTPAIKIGKGELRYDNGQFVLSIDGTNDYIIKDFQFPLGRIAGVCDEQFLQDGFSAILSFLGACAESRKYAVRNGKNAMDGENSCLFPEAIGQWAEDNQDEIDMLSMEITDTKGLLAE